MTGLNSAKAGDSQRLSPVDVAHAVFTELMANKTLPMPAVRKWSESDTRARLITPIFESVLGWSSNEVTREEPVETGFVDYVIGSDYSFLHVEAKRVTPRFDLDVPNDARVIRLNGPHLLKNKKLRAHLEQAARYGFSLGTEFCVLTNGTQFIVFKTHLKGRKWKEGQAIVFHSLEDIDANFAEFWKLLSRHGVRSGALVERFDAVDKISVSLHRAIETVPNPEMELVRNPFWPRISHIVTPLLSDDPQNKAVQDEIIQNCYVSTPLADDADGQINRLLADNLSKHLKAAGVKNVEIGMRNRSSFDRSVEEDVKDRSTGTYILTGGVGSGKTTFLRRFVTSVAPSFVRSYCVWLHIDYLDIGNVSSAEAETRIPAFTYNRIRRILTTQFPQLCPSDGGAVRTLFEQYITDSRKTVLYGLEEGSSEWTIKVNHLVQELYANDEKYVTAILTKVPRRGFRVVVVLDNTDQQGERFQEAMFLFSQRMAAACSALTIVALREEKFFAAYRRGVFDAYGPRRFHVGSPDLKDVLRKRIDYSLKIYKKTAPTNKEERVEREQVVNLLTTLSRSISGAGGEIARFLACLSNGDMRLALGWFKDFMSSGNTDVAKITRIIDEDGGYTVPLHEFMKSSVLGTRKYFKGGVSHVVNVFNRSNSSVASSFTALRLLARLSRAANAPSAHGEGFVDTSIILREFREAFGTADDVVGRGSELLRRGLIESEPPRMQDIEQTDALKITASGDYYSRYLVPSFAYLDLVYIDTPLAQDHVAQWLARLAPETYLASRFERVLAFVGYLQKAEEAELQRYPLLEGVYAERLMPSVREKLESELHRLARRQHLGTEYEAVKGQVAQALQS